MQHIVDGGCTNPTFSSHGRPSTKRKPIRQELERHGARVDRSVSVAGWPWRVLRRLLRMARPDA